MRVRALAAAMIAAVLAAGIYAMPVSAASTQQQQPTLSANGWTQHDTSHPVKVNYPCPGMPLHGQGNPQFNCTTHGASPHGLPNSVNPGSYCKNGIAYQQSRNNATVWYSWVAGSSGTNVESWVEYFWCQTSSGPYPSINWAYGNTYTDTGTSPNCDVLGVGDPAPAVNAWFKSETGDSAAFSGAALIQSGTKALIADNSPYAQWSQCPGSGNIYSYSDAANGAYAYEPHMYGFNDTKWTNGCGGGTCAWADANWGWGQYQ